MRSVRLQPTHQPRRDNKRLADETDRALRRLARERGRDKLEIRREIERIIEGLDPGEAPSVGLETLWEFNWAAQAAFDFVAAGNGTYAIGGYDYTVESMANAVLWQIDAGAGLVGRLNSTTGTWDGSAAPTAPRGRHLLGDLAPIGLREPLTLWWRFVTIDVTSDNVNTARIVCGIRGLSGNGFAGGFFGVGPVRLATSPGPGQGVLAASGTARSDAIHDEWAAPLDNEGAWDVFALRLFGSGFALAYGGIWDGGWPDLADMIQYGSMTSIGATTPSAANTVIRPNAHVGTAAASAATAAPSFILERQRITRG